jgi:hypothetical protein
MSSKFKEAPHIDQKKQKREDSTQISAEDLVGTVTGDPWEWYRGELERVLGKQRAMDFIYADSWYIAEHLNNRPSELDLVLESSERDSFPIELAPRFIQDLSEEFAKYAGVPISIPFLSITTMFSAALGKNLRVRSGASRTTPGNIFSLVFADSGSGKSDLFRKVAAPLLERQKKDRDAFNKERRPALESERDLTIAEMGELKKQAFSKKVGDYESKDEAKKGYARLQKKLAVIESMIRAPEYYGEDYTIEALGTMLKNSDEQLACIAAEALKAIQNLKGLYKEGNVEDTIYNKAYSLEPGKINRVNREPDEFDEPCIALLSFTQPDKIASLFGNEGLVQGGFVPRCISLHEYTEAQKISWDSKSVDAELFDGYRKLWNALFDGYRLGKACIKEEPGEDPFLGQGEKRKERPLDAPAPEIVTRIVQPSTEAAEHMISHFNRLTDKQNAELHDVARFAARWTENAWRIALVFHAVIHGTRAHTEPLSLETAKAATKIIDWFAAGQLQILKRGRQEAADTEVKRLCEVVKGKGGKLSKGELRDSHGFEEAAVRQLVARSNGTLKITDKPTGKKGGRPSFDVEVA